MDTNRLSVGIALGATGVLIAICAYALLAHANPAVPAVGTDMNCPTIVNGWPDVVGSPDGNIMTCFSAPIGQQVFGTRVQTDATGLYTWTFPAGCQHVGNIPYFNAVAEGPTPQGGVTVNPQVEGVPTATAVSFRVTRVSATTVALLGLTILSVNTPTATYLDLSCAPQ